MSTIEFIKHAKDIEISRIGRSKGCVTLSVDGFETQLNHRHPIGVATSLSSPECVAESLRGGHFVLEKKNDTDDFVLKEYRDSSYTGFLQTDDFIKRFGEDDSLYDRKKTNIFIPEYGQGGHFDVSCHFKWSAFKQNLMTEIGVLRQICMNGAVAMNPMFQKEVPILNLYDRHLDIAAHQLIETAKDKFIGRFESMSREHSTNREVSLALNHIDKRLKNDYSTKLFNMKTFIEEHCRPDDYYTQDAIKSGIAQDLPSNISRFDLYNIVTECNTYTEESTDSTKSAIDRLASALIFPKRVGIPINHSSKQNDTFGSPELAFFG